jgi:hypothetical protein
MKYSKIKTSTTSCAAISPQSNEQLLSLQRYHIKQKGTAFQISPLFLLPNVPSYMITTPTWNKKLLRKKQTSKKSKTTILEPLHSVEKVEPHSLHDFYTLNTNP